MDLILTIDTSLFYFFNHSLANPIFDWLMPFITSQKNWYPIYLLLILFLIIKYKMQGLWIVIAMILAVGLGDFINSHIIKEVVGRLRPCKTLDDVRLLVGCGSGKSFTSSHAVNNFGMAFVLAYYFKKYRWIFYTIAGLVAFSRVYVGVHYPLDVLAGSLLGTGFGYVAIILTDRISSLFIRKKPKW